MSEKMREEFEEWFIAESGINCLEICDMVDGRRGNFYSDPELDIKFAMNISWKAWQASRSALVVEQQCHATEDGCGDFDWVDDAVASLVGAIVNYK